MKYADVFVCLFVYFVKDMLVQCHGYDHLNTEGSAHTKEVSNQMKMFCFMQIAHFCFVKSVNNNKEVTG